METRITQFTTFCALTLFFAVWSARVASPDAGGAGSNVSDACTAKLMYEFSKSAAESADEQYKKIQEPDWSKLSNFTAKVGAQATSSKAATLEELVTQQDARSEATLEKFLSDLKHKIAVQRSMNAKEHANVTLEQARRDSLEADAKHDELFRLCNGKKERVQALEDEIKRLTAEVQALAAKLPAPAPDSKEQAPTETDDGSNQLRKQIATKQKELNGRIAEKNRLQKQGPSLPDVMSAKFSSEKAEKVFLDLLEFYYLEADLKLIETWLNARLARNKTTQRMTDAQSDYSKAVTLKDSKLGKAREEMSTLQSWISEQKNSLQGREQDEEYWKTVSEIKGRARISYTLMESDLSSLDCFGDVKNFLDDIRARRKKVEAIQIGTPVEKAPPRIARTPPAKKPTKKKLPTASKPKPQSGDGSLTGRWKVINPSTPGRWTLLMKQQGKRVGGVLMTTGADGSTNRRVDIEGTMSGQEFSGTCSWIKPAGGSSRISFKRVGANRLEGVWHWHITTQDTATVLKAERIAN